MESGKNLDLSIMSHSMVRIKSVGGVGEITGESKTGAKNFENIPADLSDPTTSGGFPPESISKFFIKTVFFDLYRNAESFFMIL